MKFKIAKRFDPPEESNWMFWMLWMAAVCNFAVGGLLAVSPRSLFQILSLPNPTSAWIWQGLGLVTALYGAAYAVAAFDPARHWRLVMIGFLGKLSGPLLFLAGVLLAEVPLQLGWLVMIADLIWLAPFAAVLHLAYRGYRAEESAGFASLRDGLESFRGEGGETLYDLSFGAPLMLVFLRHAGCTFCREALGDLASVRGELSRDGTQLFLVQMGSEREGRELAGRFGLGSTQVISDPSRRLYHTFNLRRGSLWQLLGPRVLVRGLVAGLLNGYGMGRTRGDTTQMPGAFLVRDGKVVKEYRHESIADRPDYVALASATVELEIPPSAGPAQIPATSATSGMSSSIVETRGTGSADARRAVLPSTVERA